MIEKGEKERRVKAVYMSPPTSYRESCCHYFLCHLILIMRPDRILVACCIPPPTHIAHLGSRERRSESDVREYSEQCQQFMPNERPDNAGQSSHSQSGGSLTLWWWRSGLGPARDFVGCTLSPDSSMRGLPHTGTCNQQGMVCNIVTAPTNSWDVQLSNS